MKCVNQVFAILFRRCRFAGEVIILGVRWYLRFKLSYRDVVEIAKELGGLVPMVI